MASSSNNSNPNVDEVKEEVKNILAKVVDDVGKTSALRQLVIGGTTGWLTGYTLIKVGKATAAAIGSGILLLQIANHNGYIKINWDKVTKRAEELSEKMEDSAAKPNLLKKVERFVDKKLDKAETVLKKKERKAKQWFCRATDDECFIFEEIHVFLASFLAGVAFGMTCGIILR
ncbi:FUN14 domain-containing protein 2 isoform X1 [Planococcus citri]|uniref:FUN14 domain-containing protein 2 isoform X1 n=1 Tax=Planococcus citri TaxID=170843 RepID=UPI0031F90323